MIIVVYASDLVFTLLQQKQIASFIGCLIWFAAMWVDRRSGAYRQRNPVVIFAAVALTLLGQVVSLNALQHIALILIVTANFAPPKLAFYWLLSGLLWLPSTGYVAHYLVADQLEWARLALVLALIGGIGFQRYGRSNQSSMAFVNPRRIMLLAAMVGTVLGSSRPLSAEEFTYSSVQATARPFGLDIVDQVAVAGSDAESADFMSNQMPLFQQLVNDNLSERRQSSIDSNSALVALDPTKMQLSAEATIRTYFIGEGAGYHNTLGFNAEGMGRVEGNPFLIFPDASSPRSYLSSGGDQRTISEPLMPGDFVELGTFGAGTLLDFFLIANGARGGRNTYGANPANNPDGIEHIVAFAQVENPYVLIGFEDLFGGGDEDYNDLVLAVYFGEENTSEFISSAQWSGGSVPSPEPFSLLIMLVLIGFRARFRQRAT